MLNEDNYESCEENNEIECNTSCPNVIEDNQ